MQKIGLKISWHHEGPLQSPSILFWFVTKFVLFLGDRDISVIYIVPKESRIF